ncbi:hypothetical protein SAMD00023353_0101210 [Rosellinia necatrix]|uniref:Uncharacterized protein n=1 Tax=Rosellinia necatrix TaxID=77044 RepID=A0A1S7UI76_ROSNE|nr:hypothetical protein SAMD00023353_0101210 [Rosellinia necatrix]
MDEEEAYLKYADWLIMQRRGRRRIQKAYKNPAALAKFLADIPPPRPVVLRPRHDEIRPALDSLPAYCAPANMSACLPSNTPLGFSFLGSFPPEIRNAVYQYVIHYPTCRELFDAYYDQVDTFRARNGSSLPCRFAIRLHTPTILLLCKQITREALTVLRLRPFVLDRIPPWIMGHPRPLPLTSFLSKRTLQNLRFVEIKLSLGDGESSLSGRVWFQLLEDIFRAWSGKNSLIRLKVMIKVSNLNVHRLWVFELRNYTDIVKMIDNFAFKHGSRPDLVQYEHWVLDYNYAYKCGFRNPLIRQHPDPHIWQGSILEWV